MNRAPTDFSSNADICEGYFMLQNLFSLFSFLFSLFYRVPLEIIHVICGSPGIICPGLHELHELYYFLETNYTIFLNTNHSNDTNDTNDTIFLKRIILFFLNTNHSNDTNDTIFF